MTADPGSPKTEPARRPVWPLWRLGVLLYPFAIMAVWINLFMLGLLATWTGLPNLSPLAALLTAILVAVPADYLAARWVRSLLDRANAP